MEWFTEEQAAAYLGIDIKQLRWRRWKRQITFTGRGKLVRFSKTCLDAYVQQHTKVSKWEEKAKAINSEPTPGPMKSGTSRGQQMGKLSVEARAKQIALKLRNSERPS